MTIFETANILITNHITKVYRK